MIVYLFSKVNPRYLVMAVPLVAVVLFFVFGGITGVALAQGQPAAKPGTKPTEQPLAFISIAPDGTTTILCNRMDMGQGIETGLAMLCEGSTVNQGKYRDSIRKSADFLIKKSNRAPGTNGLIGTHFIAMCADHGLTEVKGASLLAVMGIFDLVGTTLSGWLSDRYNSRVLLFWYYGLRGLSLIYLPYAFGFEFFGLPVFALFYGLDWIATVPPTVRLTNDVFGKAAAPIVFGWIVAGHQLGAAFATLGAGMMRSTLGNYTLASMISGGLCVAGAFLVLRIHRTPKQDAGRAGQPVTAPSA